MIIKTIKTFVGDAEDTKNLKGPKCCPFFINSYLIDNGIDVILIDTSFPDDIDKMPGESKFGIGIGHRIATFVVALNKTGYKVSDITKIVLTHNHIDHIGAIQAFPKAQIFINKIDFGGMQIKTPNIVKVDLSKDPKFNFQGSFKVSNGIFMLPSYGHSYGHSIVIAKDDKENIYYMFSGDSIGNLQDFIEGKRVRIAVDKKSARQTVKDLTTFIKNNKTVVIQAHEPNIEQTITDKVIFLL